ncbi:MAG: hypothetical protein HYU36_16160 [Planctomycetes bacterium]|nr:hypothetical protein [Planctomycetota bacterium]
MFSMERWGRSAVFLACLGVIELDRPALAEEAASPADLFGAGAIYYASAEDVASLKSSLLETPLGQLLSGPNASMGMGLLLGILQFGMQFTGATLDDWLGHLGSPVSLLVFPPGGAPNPPPIVIACHLRKGGAEFQNFLDQRVRRTVLRTLPWLELERSAVGPFTLERVRDTREGKTFAYTLIKDYFILGTEDGVRRLLDDQQAGLPPLAHALGYQAAQKRSLNEAHLWSYFHVAPLLEPLKAQAAGGNAARELEASGVLSLADISSSLRFEGGEATERLFLRRSEVEPQGLALIFTEPQPRPLLGGRYVPAHFPFFASVNLESGQALAEGFRKTLQRIEGEQGLVNLEQGRQFIEQGVGISIEQDVLANLTGEVFFAADAPTLKESLLTRADKPPREEWVFLLGLSIQNPDVLKNAVRQFLNSQFAWDAGLVHEVLAEEQAELIQVRNTRRDVGDNEEKEKGRGFVMAFLDEFVLLSNSADELRSVLQARAEKKTLADDAAFQERLKAYEKGMNLLIQIDVQKMTQTLFDVLEQFAEPTAQMIMKEFKPALPKLKNVLAVGIADPEGFMLEVHSSEGLLVHFLGIVALVEGIKNAPGARVVRARRNMGLIGEAIDHYFMDNGTFPPTLDALQPKYLKWMPNDPFSPDGRFRYHPGPAREENGRKLHLGGWILLSPGPDRRPDLVMESYDPDAFQKRLGSGTPDDERYFCRVTYQFKPDRYPEEDRLLDQGDLYLCGTAPH